MSGTLTDNTRYDDQTFEGVDFGGDVLDSGSFYDCIFLRCHFVEATFRLCRWVNVVFQHCDLSVLAVPGSSFSGCRFEHCKTTGIDWTAADWTTAALREPLSFLDNDLSHSTFLGLNLSHARFQKCTARDVDFREADLSHGKLAGTDLSESLFGATNLTETDFRGARNYQIDPGRNTVTGAKFSLPEALSLLYALDIEISDEPI